VRVQPTVADFLDPDGSVSAAGLGQSLSLWVERETDKTLCENIIDNPQFSDGAVFACRNALIGVIFTAIDNSKCMNRPDDPIAVFVKADLGCNRDTHARRLFTQIRKFLGG
jgi:hypothetical protein